MARSARLSCVRNRLRGRSAQVVSYTFNLISSKTYRGSDRPSTSRERSNPRRFARLGRKRGFAEAICLEMLDCRLAGPRMRNITREVAGMLTLINGRAELLCARRDFLRF